MSVVWRKETLLQQLDLSGLERWPEGNQATVWASLAEYRDIISLELGELGCMDLVKHEIRVTDDEPFRERFQRTPLWWWMKSIPTWRKCWEGFLSTSPYPRSHWKPSWSRIFLLFGPEGRLLTDCHGWSFETIHCLHHGKFRIFLNANLCHLDCAMPQLHFKD